MPSATKRSRSESTHCRGREGAADNHCLQRLRAGQRLIFARIVEPIVDLQRIRGLKAAMDQVFSLRSIVDERVLTGP